MNLRKLKRRHVKRQDRAEIGDTFDLGTGEYAGTYYCWHETRPRKVRGQADTGSTGNG